MMMNAIVMTRPISCRLWCALWLLAGTHAIAQTNKCLETDGRIVYSSRACDMQGGQQPVATPEGNTGTHPKDLNQMSPAEWRVFNVRMDCETLQLQINEFLRNAAREGRTRATLSPATRRLISEREQAGQDRNCERVGPRVGSPAAELAENQRHCQRLRYNLRQLHGSEHKNNPSARKSIDHLHDELARDGCAVR